MIIIINKKIRKKKINEEIKEIELRNDDDNNNNIKVNTRQRELRNLKM